MGLMNSIGRGISAAAGAGAEIYARGAAEDQRASIQAERDARLAELQEQSGMRAEARKNEPLNRISRNAQGKLAEDVPLEAAPVTSLSGVNDEGKKFGFQGDLKAVRAAIDQLPESADKTAALAQLQGQVATDTKTGLMNVAGKTRKRTGDEALDAAVQEAKVNDLPAYADYESRVGKPLREERRIDVTESRNDARAVAAAKDSDRKEKSAERRDETMRYIAELRDNTAQARLETLVKSNGGGASGTKEALNFIDGARKELANDAASLKALYTAEITAAGAPSRVPAIKQSYQPKFDAIDAKRKQIEQDFNALRERVGLAPAESAAPASPSTPKPTPAPVKPPAAASTGLPPGAKQIGTSGGKAVYQLPNGEKVIQN